jgi:hypothetical protein
MYKIILGKQPPPEGITPQWVLEDLAAQGHEPGTPNYAMQRFIAMNVGLISYMMIMMWVCTKIVRQTHFYEIMLEGCEKDDLVRFIIS